MKKCIIHLKENFAFLNSPLISLTTSLIKCNFSKLLPIISNLLTFIIYRNKFWVIKYFY